MAFDGQHGMMGEVVRRSYGTDVSYEEWEFVLPYLLLSRDDNQRRQHGARGTVQRGAVGGENRQSVALDAARSFTLAGSIPSDASLVAGRLF